MLFWEKFVNFSKTCKFLLKKLDNDRLKLYNVIRIKVRGNLRKFARICHKFWLKAQIFVDCFAVFEKTARNDEFSVNFH